MKAGRGIAGALVTLVLVAVPLSACQPNPKPGTIDIIGDSLAYQASYNRVREFQVGAPAGADVQRITWPGAVLGDAVAGVRLRASQGRPAILVIALGTNNADPFDGGWDAADDAVLAELMGLVSTKTCIVVVLPGYGDKPVLPISHRAEIDKARAAMIKAVSARSKLGRPSYTTDWGAFALANAALTSPDGIHLADDAPSKPDRVVNEQAADVWSWVMWSGVKRCPKPA